MIKNYGLEELRELFGLSQPSRPLGENHPLIKVFKKLDQDDLTIIAVHVRSLKGRMLRGVGGDKF